MDSTAKLVLQPQRHTVAPPVAHALTRELTEMGLIGDAVDLGGTGHYLAGPGLTELVTFLGCSPNLVLEPPAGRPPAPMDFVNVVVSGPLPVPRLRRGRNTFHPPCPACGSRQPAWRPTGVSIEAAMVGCTACGETRDAAALNWRRTAAVGRFFIDVWGVYPSEAVPAPALLDRLAQLSGGPWGYAYLLDEKGDGGIKA